MRTTLDIDDRLLLAAKRAAAEAGTTLTAVVEQALAAALTPASHSGEPFRLQWTTHSGRLIAGLDVADRDALYDAMERP